MRGIYTLSGTMNDEMQHRLFQMQNVVLLRCGDGQPAERHIVIECIGGSIVDCKMLRRKCLAKKCALNVMAPGAHPGVSGLHGKRAVIRLAPRGTHAALMYIQS